MRRPSEASADALTPRQVAARERVLDAVARFREGGISWSRALHRSHTSRATARHYVPHLLSRPGHRIVVAPSDRLRRDLHLLTPGGVVAVTTRGSRAATLVARHWNAVDRFLATGDVAVLQPFRGQKVAGHVLATDPDTIERLGRRGQLTFESLYAERS